MIMLDGIDLGCVGGGIELLRLLDIRRREFCTLFCCNLTPRTLRRRHPCFSILITSV